jgi:hypothetical protein
VNIDEATALCRAVRALCPAQAWEAETPALWAQVLAHVSHADAVAVLPALKRRHPFIDCSDIAAEVARVRSIRVDAVTMEELTSDMDGDVPGPVWLATLQARRAALMAGAPAAQILALVPPARTAAITASGEPQ